MGWGGGCARGFGGPVGSVSGIMWVGVVYMACTSFGGYYMIAECRFSSCFYALREKGWGWSLTS